MTTIYAQLIVSEKDPYGYTTYVFKNLEDNPPFGHQFKMMTRLPNWQCGSIEVSEKGFVTYDEVIAGEDKWYCKETNEMIPYNYTNIYFIKFVKEQDNSKKDIII